MLGPLLFLIFINDLPQQVSPGTRVRLFADDCLVYRNVSTVEDQLCLQRDLTALDNWAKRWGMRFNPAKCNIMRISRSKQVITKLYELCGVILEEVVTAKYLGVTISNNLEWSKHIAIVTKKASNTLSFLRRNLRYCPRKAKETAYLALVRSTIEYSSVIWDPHLQKDKDQLEKVNRRAARFVTNTYDRQRSASDLLQKLEWPTLEHRRSNQRLTMMYKVVQGLVAVPASSLEPADTRTRANHAFKFRNITTATTQYKHSFFPRTIPEWNGLKKEVAESGSLNMFRDRLP